MTVLCYGSLNPDLVHSVARWPVPGDDLFSDSWQILHGGGGGNAAVALATWGIDTTLMGHSLGTDPLGEWLLKELTMPHLDLSRIRQESTTRTPHCVVMVTPDGDRTILSTGYSDSHWQDVPGAAWDEVKVLLVDGYSGQAGEVVAAEAGRRDIPVVGLDAGSSTAGLSSLVVWSRHEHDEDEARELSSEGRPVVLTGGSGDVAMWWGNQTYRTLPPPVTPVDGTGAGDVFAAMCAYGLASGWPPEQMLRMATAAGALQAERGRATGVPTLPEITTLAGELAVS